MKPNRHRPPIDRPVPVVRKTWSGAPNSYPDPLARRRQREQEKQRSAMARQAERAKRGPGG